MTAAERKRRPVFSGVLAYFPDAILEVAYASWVGNEQHHPGTPLHWDRAKSRDQRDAATRHLMDGEGKDSEGVYHMARAAWRCLAELQLEIERERQRASRPTCPGYVANNDHEQDGA